METATTSDQEALQRTIATNPQHTLHGLRVIIIEDIGMVAMALKAALESCGCLVAGVAARLSEAEELIRREKVDGVLLDLNLGGQYAFPIVGLLRERRIPFIIMSGYDAGQLCPELAGVPQIQKPFDRTTFEALLTNEFGPHKNCGETV